MRSKQKFQWHTIIKQNEINTKSSMTQGKEGRVKITKWGPYGRAIGWEVSTKGMGGGKELKDMFPTGEGASIR
jgi:hypothetical protein